MALAIVNRVDGGVDAASSQTFSVTVTAVSPLIVCVILQGAVTVSSVVFNTSESLTQIGTKTSGANDEKTYIYGLKNPTVTTANVVVTYSGAPGGGSFVCAITTSGGDTTTGWRSTYTRNDVDGAGPGLTVVDSVNGDIVFHGAVVNAATITFDGGETTTSTIANNIAGSGFSGGMSTKPATGASTVVGCTDNAVYAEVAVAVMAAATGAPRQMMHLSKLRG